MNSVFCQHTVIDYYKYCSFLKCGALQEYGTLASKYICLCNYRLHFECKKIFICCYLQASF